MDELRLSLIVIGVVIVGVIYLVGKMVERSRTRRVNSADIKPVMARPTTPLREFRERLKTQPDDIKAPRIQAVKLPPVVVLVKTNNPRDVAKVVEPTPPQPPPLILREPNLVVSLTIVARDQQKFHSIELRKALELAGMVLAEFDIFHFRDPDSPGDKRSVFSVANIVKPGTFDVATLRDLTTPGLALFMQIPGPLTASEAFDTMLEKANFIAQRLRGVVSNEHRMPLSPQRIRDIRERTLNYDFTHAVQRDASSSPLTDTPHSG